MRDKKLAIAKALLLIVVLLFAILDLWWFGPDDVHLPVPKSGITALKTPWPECSNISEYNSYAMCTKLISLPGGRDAWSECNTNYVFITQYNEYNDCIKDKVHELTN